MKTKWPFLFLLLVLPVLVYLFLQTFGDNKFNIPVFFEAGIDQVLEGCDVTTQDTTYLIQHVSNDLEGKIVVYGFVTGMGLSKDEINNILSFLGKSEKTENMVMMLLTSDILLLEQLDHKKLEHQVMNRKKILGYARCTLQVDMSYDDAERNFSNSQLVLCDEKGRIRGYYDKRDLEEMDRLSTELDILLNQRL